ncbi:MAG: M48 family metalloprotease [Gammaproteobacteria bacterium]|nr:M48 family metalloprotease [Gammaproteobacteria bacterium]
MILISGCGALSLDEENRLGDEEVIRIASNTSGVTDPEIIAYIDEVVANLLAASPAGAQEITLRIINSEAFNSFAIAGGNIYLTTGTILACRNVSELASILAHEIAHVKQGHITNGYRRYQASRKTAQLAGITLAIATGNPFIAGAGDVAANMGSSIYIGIHSRASETEADELAYHIMQGAGYDPRSQLTLLARLRISTIGQEIPPPFLLTHPLPQERMTETENRLRLFTEKKGFKVNDEGRLEAIQNRLK